jgi:hypothetical protein
MGKWRKQQLPDTPIRHSQQSPFLPAPNLLVGAERFRKTRLFFATFFWRQQKKEGHATFD